MTDAHASPEIDGDAPPAVRIRTHPALCQGWGECHRWAPNVYPLDEHGHIAVHLVDVPSELADDAWWGATACPERAITLIGPPEAYWFERLRRRHDHNRQDPQTTPLITELTP